MYMPSETLVIYLDSGLKNEHEVRSVKIARMKTIFFPI